MGQKVRDIAELGLPGADVALQLRLWHIDRVGVHGTGIRGGRGLGEKKGEKSNTKVVIL